MKASEVAHKLCPVAKVVRSATQKRVDNVTSKLSQSLKQFIDEFLACVQAWAKGGVNKSLQLSTISLAH